MCVLFFIDRNHRETELAPAASALIDARKGELCLRLKLAPCVGSKSSKLLGAIAFCFLPAHRERDRVYGQKFANMPKNRAALTEISVELNELCCRSMLLIKGSSGFGSCSYPVRAKRSDISRNRSISGESGQANPSFTEVELSYLMLSSEGKEKIEPV